MSNDSKNSSFGVGFEIVEVRMGGFDLDFGLEERLELGQGVGLPSGRYAERFWECVIGVGVSGQSQFASLSLST